MTLYETIKVLATSQGVSAERIEAAIRLLQGAAVEAVVDAVVPKRRGPGRPPKDRSTLSGMLSPHRLEDFSPLVQRDLTWAFGEIQAGRTDRGERLIKGCVRAKTAQKAYRAANPPPATEIRPGVWVWDCSRSPAFEGA